MERNRRVVMLGYGAVAQCALPLLVKELKLSPREITIIDFEDKRAGLGRYLEQGVTFVQAKVEKNNLPQILGKHLNEGDVLIDLAWNIDCVELLTWAHEKGVLYLNTSVEVWDPYENAEKLTPQQRTLYHRHMKVRALVDSWKTPGATAVLEHGANPGLISHWTKFGLMEIGRKLLSDGKAIGTRREKIQQAITDHNFPQLAQLTGVKVIHCSERDTQVTNVPKQVDEFVNTWSIEGFREEGTTTAEMGWGTHEKTLPEVAFEHAEGPKNQICLARMGMNTWVRSWVPNYEIQGMVVRHGEAFTISDKLTVRAENGQAVYRPTVHYAYCPTDSAIASLNELRGYNYRLQPKLRILNDEITSGADILGSLLMGHDYQSWWVGSLLTIEESRRLVPHQNATTLQVAISVVAATAWMIQNPNKGVVVPDDLPHDFILKMANPYLGESISTPVDWNPLAGRKAAFGTYAPFDTDETDPWQFKNFLVGKGE